MDTLETKEGETERPLPKAIPISMMNIIRLQGQLQLEPSGGASPSAAIDPNSADQSELKEFLKKLQGFLAESGQKTILISDKAKKAEGEPYFELRLQERGLQLIQANASSKLETNYFFETGKLSIGNSAGDSGQDLEKFANKIKMVSTWMAENKADTVGES